MSLRSPNLDDRTFDQLVEEARQRIAHTCPQWTDLSPGDPGQVLVDVFAHLTEMMIYRLNRLPEKAYVEFLSLIGVRLQPPAAAVAELRFSLSRTQDRSVEIPRGTRVTTPRADGGTEPPVFATAEAVRIEPGKSEVTVQAYHCDLVEAELLGTGSGMPGLSLTAGRPPIVAPNRDGRDLVVAIEAQPGELDLRTAAVRHGDKAYRVWREVDNFSDPGSDRHAYIVDRLAGTITFAPAVRLHREDGALQELPEALAEVPPAGREIRAWYRCGGGAGGNLSANMLTVLKTPIPGVEVSNPLAATGGSSAEGLENALLRGPQELHSLQRAVTARDFELVATRNSGAVDRAKAFTKAMLWAHAPPGTVEVILVPSVPADLRGQGRVSVTTLQEQETEAARTKIQQAVDARRPLGTTCLVNWAHYKTVHARARVVVHREEDPDAVKNRVLQRLYETINPLSRGADVPAWPFGQALTGWDVYKIAGAEPGVKSISHVRLRVEEVPAEAVVSLTADAYQARTWYAATGDAVYRSLNNGQGWEPVRGFSDEEVLQVNAYPREAGGTQSGRAGLLAVATRLAAGGSRVHLSRDCGETWEAGPQTQFRVEDMAWMERDGIPSLLLATELGLYELAGTPGSVPIQILVDPQDLSLGFYAVAVSTDVWGATSVAVAARGDRGVFLSSEGGRPGSFHPIGLEGELVRVLAVQHRGPHRYLWAGVAAAGPAPGKGGFRWRLTGSAEAPEGWRGYHKNWRAGGCRSLAFQGEWVLAASLRLGVLRLNLDAREPAWEPPAVSCGLPLQSVGQLHPVDAVAADAEGRLALAAGIEGVYRSKDQGVQYAHCSGQEFSDEVTLPQTWLFCSGDHKIEVVSEDEAERD